jgi:hypothetical protein
VIGSYILQTRVLTPRQADRLTKPLRCRIAANTPGDRQTPVAERPLFTYVPSDRGGGERVQRACRHGDGVAAVQDQGQIILFGDSRQGSIVAADLDVKVLS